MEVVLIATWDYDGTLPGAKSPRQENCPETRKQTDRGS